MTSTVGDLKVGQKFKFFPVGVYEWTKISCDPTACFNIECDGFRSLSKLDSKVVLIDTEEVIPYTEEEVIP